MKLLDVLILLPLLWGALHGYRKGLLIEIIGILGMVVAMVLGFKFLGLGMEVLTPYFSEGVARKILPYVGFSAIFWINSTCCGLRAEKICLTSSVLSPGS